MSDLVRQELELVVDGVRLYAARVPPADGHVGPVIVLLHDGLGSVGLWRDFPERLAKVTGLGVLAYDRRGHGASEPYRAPARTVDFMHEEAATLEHLLAAAGIEDAVLFGHSDGGTIALLAAGRLPGRVRAVVAEAAHVFVEERTLEGIREAERGLVAGDLLARLERYHGANARALATTWTGVWLSQAFRAWNVEAELSRIRCPVLVVQGDLDEYGTEAQVHAIARGVAGPARTVLLPGVRHSPHRDAPEAVLGLTAEHLASAAP